MTNEVAPFLQTPSSPVVPAGEEGVWVALERPLGSQAPILRGACAASLKTAQGLSDSILHNVSIVSSFGPDLMPRAFPLIQGEIVFPDDIRDEAGRLVAYFNVDLARRGLPPGGGAYHITAVFHHFLSNTVSFVWSR